MKNPEKYNSLIFFLFSLSRFQKFFGLKQTGKLDDATINAMKAPRCGVGFLLNKNSSFLMYWKFFFKVPDNVEDDSELGFRKFKIG